MEVYFNNLTSDEDAADRLLHDLRALRNDTEELFRAAGDKLAERSKKKFLTAMEKASKACREVRDQATAEVQNADQVIHEYPYSAVGVAFGLGMLLAVLMLRRAPR